MTHPTSSPETTSLNFLLKSVHAPCRSTGGCRALQLVHVRLPGSSRPAVLRHGYDRQRAQGLLTLLWFVNALVYEFREWLAVWISSSRVLRVDAEKTVTVSACVRAAAGTTCSTGGAFSSWELEWSLNNRLVLFGNIFAHFR